jgi:hypothetical protein
MTQVVTVHTDFTDLNQMAQGLVGRVNDTHVILPGPDPVDVGEWVEFAVTLYDGTPGFAGVGRCVTVVDNGEERLSHQRFDVVIDSLQFDSRGQQVFEHILTLNGAGGGGYDDPPAEEGVEEANFDDVSEVYTQSKIELPTEALEEAAIAARVQDDDEEDENTVIGDSMQFAGAAFDDPEQDDHQRETPRPPAPASYGGAPTPPVAQAKPSFSEPPTGSVSVIPSAPPPPPPAPSIPAPSVAPLAVGGASTPPRPAQQTNGGAMFAYANGLPFPAVPPRPELDPSRRVSPAPRPRTADAATHEEHEQRTVG